MTALAAIHVAKKALGLDDDTYRDLLERETGKRSAKDMTSAELDRVLAVMRRASFKPASKGFGPRLEGPFARKLQALWIAAWNLGLVRDRRDSALLAFVERQTGISRTEWLRDPADARKAVEALKSWIAREGGVDWSTARILDWQCAPGYQIARAQMERLRPGISGAAFWSEVMRIIGRASFGEKPSDAEWIVVMDALGRQLRGLAKRTAAA